MALVSKWECGWHSERPLKPKSGLNGPPFPGQISYPALQQLTSALLQQLPVLPIPFPAIASLLLRRREGAQHGDPLPMLPKQQRGRDQIPDVFGNDVGGEDVDLLERVVTLSVVVGMELAEVSGAGAHGGGLHLNAKIVALVFDADVVGLGISPGLADGEAALGCRRHELQFDPFAALFVTSEFLPILHDFRRLSSLSISPSHVSQNQRDMGHPQNVSENTKGATMGRASFAGNLLYIFRIPSWRGYL